MGESFTLAVTGDILLGDQIVRDGVVLVQGERIAGVALGPAPKAETLIDARGCFVLPGIIDSHVHSLSDPGEGLTRATRAACAGGVTTIIDMPVDAPLGIARPEDLRTKIEKVEAEAVIDAALLASVKNETVANIPKLAELGCCGFKLSLFDTEPNRFPRVSDGYLLDAFAAIKKTDLTAGVHAENDEIINHLIRRLTGEGQASPRDHARSRPEVSETESVLKGLEIARASGVRFHLYHLSCSRSVDLADLYRREGCAVTLETCPHYLVFSEADMDRLGALIKINPPVRPEVERDRLWERVRAGLVNCVSSDHAPWPLEKKNKPSIFDNASGAPGVQTLAPVMFSEGVAKGRIDVQTFSRILSENPARLFGLYPDKGRIRPGALADLVIIDPEKSWTVRDEDMFSAAAWSPYEGMTLSGRIRNTIARGRIVYRDGEILSEPGWGRFVRPSMSVDKELNQPWIKVFEVFCPIWSRPEICITLINRWTTDLNWERYWLFEGGAPLNILTV